MKGGRSDGGRGGGDGGRGGGDGGRYSCKQEIMCGHTCTSR